MTTAPTLEDIRLERHEPHVLLVTIDRPKVRNALRTNTLREIAEALAAAETDDLIRVVVITGGPTVFAAGADINELAEGDPTIREQRIKHWSSISRFPKPLLAAVNGYALGAGCELLMTADIAIAGQGAKLGQPEIKLGTMPGAGGTQRLVRAVGKPLAMKMVLAGEPITANTALAAGLLAEVVEDEKTIPHTLALAATIAERSPLALRLAKDSLSQAYELALEAGLRLEREHFDRLAKSEDRREGLAAFQEKRPPQFVGR